MLLCAEFSLFSTQAETVVRIHSTSHDQQIQNASVDGATAVTGAAEIEADNSIDRIIDSQDNEFILSKPSSELAALTLDPRVG